MRTDNYKGLGLSSCRRRHGSHLSYHRTDTSGSEFLRQLQLTDGSPIGGAFAGKVHIGRVGRRGTDRRNEPRGSPII